MQLVSNRELSEERIKLINKEKRFVGMTMKKKVAVKEATAAPTARKKLHQTKRNNRTLMAKNAVPKKMNSRLSQWKIIVSWTELFRVAVNTLELTVFAFFSRPDQSCWWKTFTRNLSDIYQWTGWGEHDVKILVFLNRRVFKEAYSWNFSTGTQDGFFTKK